MSLEIGKLWVSEVLAAVHYLSETSFEFGLPVQEQAPQNFKPS